MDALASFAQALSELLDSLGVSTYELARRITAKYGDQGSKTYVEGTSRDALDDYKRGQRPPRPQAWNAIKAVLREDGTGSEPGEFKELDRLHKEALTEWHARKRPAAGVSVPAYNRRSMWVSLSGYVLAAGVLAWSFWAQRPVDSNLGAGKKPSQSAHRTDWDTRVPTAQLISGELPVWSKIDKADPDEAFEAYEYVAAIPPGFTGAAMRLGIAGAEKPLELLLYKNHKFLESRHGTDVHIDFTDGPATWRIRIRNWNREDVRYLPYLVVRNRS